MQNAWHTAIGLTFLFFFAAMIPMVSALNESNELKHISPKENFDGPVMNHPTQLLFKEPHYKTTTGGRAACVAQSDAGTPGDAGGDANTSRSLGTNPNSGQTGVQGCMDTADTEDWYEVTITAGKDVDVELTVPSTADFDLYLVDSAGTEVDASLSISALEKVSTSGTSLSSTAGTFYIRILAYSGDGQYSLRT